MNEFKEWVSVSVLVMNVNNHENGAFDEKRRNRETLHFGAWTQFIHVYLQRMPHLVYSNTCVVLHLNEFASGFRFICFDNVQLRTIHWTGKFMIFCCATVWIQETFTYLWLSLLSWKMNRILLFFSKKEFDSPINSHACQWTNTFVSHSSVEIMSRHTRCDNTM